MPIVTPMSACPTISRTMCGGTPRPSRSETAECRRSWNRSRPSTPARAGDISRVAGLSGSNGVPIVLVDTRPHSRHPSVCVASQACRARWARSMSMQSPTSGTVRWEDLEELNRTGCRGRVGRTCDSTPNPTTTLAPAAPVKALAVGAQSLLMTHRPRPRRWAPHRCWWAGWSGRRRTPPSWRSRGRRSPVHRHAVRSG